MFFAFFNPIYIDLSLLGLEIGTHPLYRPFFLLVLPISHYFVNLGEISNFGCDDNLTKLGGRFALIDE